jgi:hypothetical protein
MTQPQLNCCALLFFLILAISRFLARGSFGAQDFGRALFPVRASTRILGRATAHHGTVWTVVLRTKKTPNSYTLPAASHRISTEYCNRPRNISGPWIARRGTSDIDERV